MLRDDWQSHFLRKQAEEGKSLRQWLDVFGIEAHSAPHMQTVQVTLALLSGLIEAKKDAVPQALTTATIATSAAALQGFVRGKVTLDQLEEQLDHVVCHQEATQQEARLERVRMALRLLDWPGPPRSCSWSWMR